MKSTKSGLWTDPWIWDSQTGDIEIAAGHTVTINTFVQTEHNIIVKGTLVMRAKSGIEFLNIIESNYQGGRNHHGFVASDIGLWVIDQGKLDIQGAIKRRWTEAQGVSKGATVLSLVDPIGWKSGDHIVIMPMAGIGERPSSEYEERHIISMTGNQATLDRALGYDHPAYTTLKGEVCLPEVIRLSSDDDIVIQGTSSGRAHCMITSSSAQTIKGSVVFRHMGPRADIAIEFDGQTYPKDGIKELVLGRYALHFHHVNFANSGAIFEGLLVRDAGNHAFVPHGTHEVTLRDCASYNVKEDAFWQDFQHKSHGVKHQRCIAARLLYEPGAYNEDRAPGDDISPRTGVNGFLIGVGDDNEWEDCRVIGATGDEWTNGGFKWEANNDGAALKFFRCRSHNCNVHNMIWQISPKNHIVDESISFLNRFDHTHGAYQNGYNNQDLDYNGEVQLKANASLKGQDWIRCSFKDVRVIAAQVNAERPTRIINSVIHGNLIYEGMFTDGDNEEPTRKMLDVINTVIKGTITMSPDVPDHEVIRVQPPIGPAYKITKAGKTEIPDFAPRYWGNGDGLKGEYFKADGTLAVSRVDIQLAYQDFANFDLPPATMMDVHYKLGQDQAFKGKWTGFIEAHYTEEHEVWLETVHPHQIKINGVDITLSRKVSLVQGQRTPIEIYYQNRPDLMLAHMQSGFILCWRSPSLAKMIEVEPIPQSQLYSEQPSTPPPPSTAASSDLDPGFSSWNIYKSKGASLSGQEHNRETVGLRDFKSWGECH